MREATAAATPEDFNGVLLVGEALGEEEAECGHPFVGRAGKQLSMMLQRRGLDRGQFAIDNVLRCRPPGNRLNGAPYEQRVISECSWHLRETIAALKPKCLVAMGEIPLKALLGVTDLDLDIHGNLTERRGYAEISQRFGLPVVPTFHPAYLMRGNQHLTDVWLWDVEKAIGIARDGWEGHRATHLLDPTPAEFLQWVIGYERALEREPGLALAYDIETPMSAKGVDEGELEIEDDPTYQILRIGFSYRDGMGVSIPWSGAYMHGIKRVLGGQGTKLTWNGRYDHPRVVANGVTIGGMERDLMWAWHVCQSTLPKGLGFVASILAKGQRRWKYLADSAPALYNATDAEVTFRLGVAIQQMLKDQRLEAVFERHVRQLDQLVLWPASARGIRVSPEKREEAAKLLTVELDGLVAKMDGVIPLEARRLRVYKKRPEGASLLVELPVRVKAKVCSRCGEQGVTKPHVGKKTLGKGIPNPCHGADIEIREVNGTEWGVPLPFTPSNTQLKSYQGVMEHDPILNKEGNPTFDDMALKRLIKKYPGDPLYPVVSEYRELDKLAGTYVGRWDAEAGSLIGGVPVRADGKVHTTYTHNPATLRLSSQAPNMQNIPRGTNKWNSLVKLMFVADPGTTFVEIDFSAIEAVLVGYLAGSPTYMRLAKLGVHDFLNSHLLAREGKIKAPVDLSWPDPQIKEFFGDLKARFNAERDVAKRIVHGGNYGMTPNRMRDLYPELFPTLKRAKDLQDLYYEVCPDVRKWQDATVALADSQGYLRNPFGYLMRFWGVRNWTLGRDGVWAATWAEDAKAALAFGPQSTAAGIIREAMVRIAEAGLADYILLQIHDSLLIQVPDADLDSVVGRITAIMEAPVEALPLDPTWGMGDYVTIGTEAKWGKCWGEMKKRG